MRSRGKSIRCEEIRMEWLLFLVRDFLGGGVGFLAPGATAAPLKSPTYGRIWRINHPCRAEADSSLLHILYLNRRKLVRTHDTTAISIPRVASAEPADDVLTARRTAVDDHDPRYSSFISDVNDL